MTGQTTKNSCCCCCCCCCCCSFAASLPTLFFVLLPSSSPLPAFANAQQEAVVFFLLPLCLFALFLLSLFVPQVLSELNQTSSNKSTSSFWFILTNTKNAENYKHQKVSEVLIKNTKKGVVHYLKAQKSMS